MSDNSITIKKLLDLDEGIFTKMSEITLEAVIKEAKPVYERKVKAGKRKGETFWSQKVVIDDGTGTIVLDLITNKAEDAVPRTAVGKKIRVENAKADIYKDERRLVRGKASLVNGGQRIPSGGAAPLQNGYYMVVGPNEKVVVHPDIHRARDMLITRTAVAKSLIKKGERLTKKGAKQEAEEWVKWIYGNTAPVEQAGKEKKQDTKKDENKEKEGLDGVVDPDFDRDKMIGRLGGRFGELFVAGKTKGLNLEEWLNKNYEVKSFIALSDDYLVEIDSVFDDMFEELQKELH